MLFAKCYDKNMLPSITLMLHVTNAKLHTLIAIVYRLLNRFVYLEVYNFKSFSLSLFFFIIFTQGVMNKALIFNTCVIQFTLTNNMLHNLHLLPPFNADKILNTLPGFHSVFFSLCEKLIKKLILLKVLYEH